MSRSRQLVIAAVVVAALAIAAMLLVSGSGTHGDVSPQDSAGEQGAPEDPAGDADSGGDTTADAEEPATTATFPFPVMDDKPVGKAVTVDGVAVTVTAVAVTESDGVGAGELAGPALAVSLRLVNRGSEPIDLDSVGVAATWGPQGTPAMLLPTAGAADPVRGSLAVGSKVTGVYAFHLPDPLPETLSIAVLYRAGEPAAVFVADVPTGKPPQS